MKVSPVEGFHDTSPGIEQDVVGIRAYSTSSFTEERGRTAGWKDLLGYRQQCSREWVSMQLTILGEEAQDVVKAGGSQITL